MVYIIADLGSNWEEREDIIKSVEGVAATGADAFKIQLLSDNMYSYGGENRYISDMLKENSKRYILPMDLNFFKRLKRECKKYKIDFLCSAFSLEGYKFLEENKLVNRHKVASSENNHLTILDYLNSVNANVIISLGGSTIKDVDFIIKRLKNLKDNQITFLECTLNYPAKAESFRINRYKYLDMLYPYNMGLSDHTPYKEGTDLTFLVTFLGAEIIEKHIYNLLTPYSPDYPHSLNLTEFKEYVNKIRLAEKLRDRYSRFLFGNDTLEGILPEEEITYIKYKRAIHAIKTIKRGDKLVIGVNVDILRPGANKRGMDPFSFVNGSIATKNYRKGQGIEGGVY